MTAFLKTITLSLFVFQLSIAFAGAGTSKSAVKSPAKKAAIKQTETTPPITFKDMNSDHWAAASVQKLVARKIMSGRPNGKFEGNRSVTRFELAVALDRFIQQVETGLKKGGESLNNLKSVEKPKVNVPAKHWSYNSMLRLAQYGYLPVKSPVLQGPKETLTAKEVGEAFGQVGIRLTDLISHEPDDEPAAPQKNEK